MIDGPLLDSPPSPLRAWVALVWLSLRRQAQIRQMVGIALGLMAVSVMLVSATTFFDGWSRLKRRAWPHRMTYNEHLQRLDAVELLAARTEPAAAVQRAVVASARAAASNSAFVIFSRWVVFAIFLGFLLPLWTISFATDGLGSEREGRTLIWLFTRPLPRSSIYLAKLLAVLPWCLGLNLIGFAAICVAAGEPGYQALRMFWPTVVAGTIAFAALFHLIAALFRRPAIIALLYSFFFEALVGDLPGDLKRVSLSFYIRSLMFDATAPLKLEPTSLTVYSPVSATTAWSVLIGVTIVLTAIGMWAFARREYPEDV